jgi:hypothetical protein
VSTISVSSRTNSTDVHPRSQQDGLGAVKWARYRRAMALEPWAKSQAEDLIAPLGDRWLHVQAVAGEARRVGLETDVFLGRSLLFNPDIGMLVTSGRAVTTFDPDTGEFTLVSHRGHAEDVCATLDP